MAVLGIFSGISRWVSRALVACGICALALLWVEFDLEPQARRLTLRLRDVSEIRALALARARELGREWVLSRNAERSDASSERTGRVARGAVASPPPARAREAVLELDPAGEPRRESGAGPRVVQGAAGPRP